MAKTEITQTVPIPVRAGQDPIPPLKTSANATQETATGGVVIWLSSYLNTLPQWIDDITRDFGDDLYERMMLDPQVASNVLTLKANVMQDGVSFLPVEDQKDKQGTVPRLFGRAPRQSSDKAKEIASFVESSIRNLEGEQAFEEICAELLDGVFLGNKLAEQVYKVVGSNLVLSRIKTKPRYATGYVLDIQNNFVGVLPVGPNQTYPTISDMTINTGESRNTILPRSKFVVFSWMTKNGDPRGNSLLRPVYNPWWQKQQTFGELLRYISQFAGPSLYATQDKDAVQLSSTDGKTPAVTLLNDLLQFRNGTALVMPPGSELHAIEMNGDGKAFITALDMFDRQISKAMTGQVLATDEAQHQARASSQVHQDILGLIVLLIRQTLAMVIRRDICVPLVRYNFGDDAVALTPEVRVGGTEMQDFAANATAIAALTTAGYLDDSQFDPIDQDLGLPARAPDWMAQKQARADKAAASKPDPNASPSGAPPKDKAAFSAFEVIEAAKRAYRERFHGGQQR